MEITERDKALLELIAKTGVCTITQAQTIYDKKWYHYKRIDVLEKNNYIKKTGKYLELTAKSYELLGEKPHRFRHEGVKKQQARLTELALDPDLEYISSRDIRRDHQLNRRVYLRGALVVNNIRYLLYILPKSTTQVNIGVIHAEIQLLAQSGISQHTIVLSPDSKASALFGEGGHRQKELFLLPHSVGIDILKAYPSVIEQTRQKYKNPQVTDKLYAHYETPEKYITIMTTNDLVKRGALMGYFASPHQPKPVDIICYETQRLAVKTRFPQAEIIIINKED